MQISDNEAAAFRRSRNRRGLPAGSAPEASTPSSQDWSGKQDCCAAARATTRGTSLVTVGALAGGWAVFVVVGNSWWTLAVAALLAVLFTQVGFLGHDAGHRQIFASRRSSYISGVLLGNLGIGLSFGWWVAKHNRHHAHPNTEGADPDIDGGALIFSASQLNPPEALSG